MRAPIVITAPTAPSATPPHISFVFLPLSALRVVAGIGRNAVLLRDALRTGAGRRVAGAVISIRNTVAASTAVVTPAAPTATPGQKSLPRPPRSAGCAAGVSAAFATPSRIGCPSWARAGLTVSANASNVARLFITALRSRFSVLDSAPRQPCLQVAVLRVRGIRTHFDFPVPG